MREPVNILNVYVGDQYLGDLQRHAVDDPDVRNLYSFTFRSDFASLNLPPLSLKSSIRPRQAPYYFLTGADYEALGGGADAKVTHNGKTVSVKPMPGVFYNGYVQGLLLKAVMQSPQFSHIDFEEGRNILAILAATGAHPIGNLRCTLPGQPLPTPNQSVIDIDELTQKINGALDGKRTVIPKRNALMAVLESYAAQSGIPGNQPKIAGRVNVEDVADELNMSANMHTPTSFGFSPAAGRSSIPRFTGMNFSAILKAESDDCPGTSFNEYTCLFAVRQARLAAPYTTLSDDGTVLISRRFDRVQSGHAEESRFFEDFVSIMGRPHTAMGYGFPVRVDKRTPTFYYHLTLQDLLRSSADYAVSDGKKFLMQLLGQIYASTLLRNSDNHLRNYGLLYDLDEKSGSYKNTSLSPLYDVMVTDIYHHIRPGALMTATKKQRLTLGSDSEHLHRQDFVNVGLRMGLSRNDIEAALRPYDKVPGIICGLFESSLYQRIYKNNPGAILIAYSMKGSLSTAYQDNFPGQWLPITPKLDALYSEMIARLESAPIDKLQAFFAHYGILKPIYQKPLAEMLRRREVIETSQTWYSAYDKVKHKARHEGFDFHWLPAPDPFNATDLSEKQDKVQSRNDGKASRSVGQMQGGIKL